MFKKGEAKRVVLFLQKQFFGWGGGGRGEGGGKEKSWVASQPLNDRSEEILESHEPCWVRHFGHLKAR